MKTRCIGVRSVTYAQKGRDLLNAKGIPCRILRQQQISGCGWCIAVSGPAMTEATSFLREKGVKLTGDFYDLS